MALKKQQKESAEVPAQSEQRRGTEAGRGSSDQLSGVSHDTEHTVSFCFPFQRCVKYLVVNTWSCFSRMDIWTCSGSVCPYPKCLRTLFSPVSFYVAHVLFPVVSLCVAPWSRRYGVYNAYIAGTPATLTWLIKRTSYNITSTINIKKGNNTCLHKGTDSSV